MEATQFIELNAATVFLLILIGFVGGMVSGFIGSGGAFVLTPAMMSLGAPAMVAVASNICHKFPKALVGAAKRHKYGQVDVKLGLILGVIAEAGMLYGKHLMTEIKLAFGRAGTDLYVSAIFIVVLAVVGGFIGVPAMIYVLGVPAIMASATELVIAFVMGLGGTVIYGLEGAVAAARDVDHEVVIEEAEEPWRGICDAAEEYRADVIVMGRRGKRGLARNLMGDATAKVIGHAPCSVIVAPRGAKDFTHGVLVATVKGMVAEGRPEQMIVDQARNLAADLIVIGTHGRSGLDRLLMGSVAERMIGFAECPVLAVKAT